MMAAGRSVGTRIIAIASLAAGLALAGCANGDFDRVKPGLVTDDIHNWVGTTAALGNGAPISDYPLTDDERLLRDLAYPLIEPPYDRQQWFSVLNEYGIGRIFHHDWSRFDEQAYMRALMGTVFRSESGRYGRLGDDIRNDRTRVPPFFEVAGRVLDMDRKREKNLAAVSYLTEREQFMAVARTGENALVISWVQWSLVARAVSYRVALERLSIASPMPMATDLDRSIVALGSLIDHYRLLPAPDVAPGPGVLVVPPFQGPVLGPRGRPLSVLGSTAPAMPPSIEAAKLDRPPLAEVAL
jgi:hypothetical protein